MMWIDELCRAVATVDPGFPEAVQPAPPEDVARLTALVGRELPERYKQFLSVMGSYDGGLFYLERCDMRIGSVIAYCERQKLAGRAVDPDRCIPIGIGADFGGFCLTLVEGTTEPAIALFEALEPDEIVFPELPVLVFAKAFLFEMAATGRRLTIGEIPGETADSLARKLIETGFDKEWYSFGNNFYLRHGGGGLVISARDPRRPTVELGGRDETSLARTLSGLRSVVGNVEYRERRKMSLPEIRVLQRQTGWS